MSPHSLIYIADPMCSWCWGFSLVLEEIRRLFQDRVTFQLMLGGLRPGNTERFDESRRVYILQHWHAVHERTGQPFNFDFQMGPTFTYDTEPASRATVVVRQLAPGKEWDFLKGVQEAFYVQNADVTKAEVLDELAVPLGMEASQFHQSFQDSQTKQLLWEEFDQSRQLGVSGFPTLLGRKGQSVSALMHGYQDVKTLAPVIEQFLQKVA
ncbi:MAG: DsbA family protein [Nitrospirales bacterium]|nr:MAG: DsbA family protein [Nitrospirales bacterium]